MESHLPFVLGLFQFSASTLTHLLDTWGYPLVALFIAVESSGIPFPGETMLVTAAVYAGTGHLSIGWVITFAAAGAIIGDNLGYVAGRYGGRRLVARFGKYIWIRPHHLDYAERFFQKHGDKTVFFGRHLAILRAWAAFLAGTNRMPWPKFLFYNAAGGVVWTAMYGTLGYVLGNNLPVLHRVISVLGIGGAVATALGVIAGLIIWKRRQARRSGISSSTNQISS
ncbi:MAG: DedA family protein [Chloroflexota bacterium]